MMFPRPLVRAELVQRYKRFLSDHRLESGEIVTAHCANPGRMIGIKEPGMATWLAPAGNLKRKLQWDWELVFADDTLIGCHTGRPNGLVEEAILDDTITELSGYAALRREVKYGENSRIDMLLTDPDRPDCYVEVKYCHMRRETSLAEFPDSVTTRGAKHMAELANMVEAGHRSVLIYCIERMDCDGFTTADDIDPDYDAALRDALARGVEAYAYSCRLTEQEISIDRRLPTILD
ncbi:MAG: DNA/RNA nuclease SfsA [Alphaproteobacteria bacterium]|jgi:sugar fermentation stimulation protein A|nr:DNA/RNA nuclease SfsA [Rhodospirillaceae bacterium]MBT6202758.1 DNA/RNA nuclease SfsA [Rhodospirillaceae bacterium]MBT7646116.1 DNA/RNA nuclease SfsA [Rhodospirillaceae bacterium]MDG2482020.1 DNA/RNA nuclease SfsA [Alphaproteobacteria bacterium]